MVKIVRGRIVEVIVLVVLAALLMAIFDLLLYTNIDIVPTTPMGSETPFLVTSHISENRQSATSKLFLGNKRDTLRTLLRKETAETVDSKSVHAQKIARLKEEGIQSVEKHGLHNIDAKAEDGSRSLVDEVSRNKLQVVHNKTTTLIKLEHLKEPPDNEPPPHSERNLEPRNSSQKHIIGFTLEDLIVHKMRAGTVPNAKSSQSTSNHTADVLSQYTSSTSSLSLSITTTLSAAAVAKHKMAPGTRSVALRVNQSNDYPLISDRHYQVSVDARQSPHPSNGQHTTTTLPRSPGWDRILSSPSVGFHSFNTTASDLVGNHREYPELRLPECRGRRYEPLRSALTVSVIVVFHNEARSPLLRTVHSVLERSPARMLSELILVDDCSTMPWLLEPLADYVAGLSGKVKLLRFQHREGLIRARLLGAEKATGDVLIFLDSHIEVSDQWLEPLLAEVDRDPATIAIPTLDIIHWKTFQISRAVDNYQGSFLWNLDFKYKLLPRVTVAQREDPTAAYPSHVMVGCAHALRRDYFFQLGAYDAAMDIWGGENLEHSFRTWMCGGRVVIVPCSRTAHVFKPRLPYSFRDNAVQVIQRNLMRVAEVWMDDYAKYFYALQSALPPLELRSLDERKRLRRRLQCKSFDWYLRTVATDVIVPPLSATHFGQLRSQQFDLKCAELDERDEVLSLVSCERQEFSNHYFYIDNKGVFWYKDYCLTVHMGALTFSEFCPDAYSNAQIQEEYVWLYTDSKLINAVTKMCLTVSQWNTVIVAECKMPTGSDISVQYYEQMWQFTYYFNFSRAWNLETVLQDSIARPADAVLFGALENAASGKCLRVFDGASYELVECTQQAVYERVIYLDGSNYLRYKALALGLRQKSNGSIANIADTAAAAPTRFLHVLPFQQVLALKDSADTYRWHLDSRYNWLQIAGSVDLCLTLEDNAAAELSLAFQTCHADDTRQQWRFRPPSPPSTQ